MNGSDSKKVAEIIGSDFTAAGAEQDVIVFDSATLKVTDQEYQDVIDKVLESVRGQPGVVSLVGPTDPGATDQVSADKHAALASFGLSGDDRQRSTRASDLQDRVTAAAGSGAVEAYLTGYSASSNDLTEVENADVERAKSIGIPVAFVVLITALGTMVAAFIPLLTAVIRLTFTFGVLSALVLWRPMDSFLLSIVMMLGVGISIDYSLFVFGCVLLADVLELKEFGFALAAAVVLDATLIRLLLVPAIMKVAGGKADWWLPGFLERILPRVKVEWLAVGREGTAHHAGEAR